MNKPFIAADKIHIWSASLTNHENNFDYFLSILSKNELERVKNFKFFKDKKQYILARGILRNILGCYLDKTPQDIDISYSIFGKPYISGEKPSLYFNISHSGPYALYAFTLDYEVGIDLECIDKNLELENMASHVFSPSELFYWKSLKAEEKEECFFKIWVCKEAILKASGRGWLENEVEASWFDVRYLKDSPTYIIEEKIKYPYCFDCIPGYKSAIFVEGPPLYLHQFTYK